MDHRASVGVSLSRLVVSAGRHAAPFACGAAGHCRIQTSCGEIITASRRTFNISHLRDSGNPRGGAGLETSVGDRS
jgi:hypothetical protein